MANTLNNLCNKIDVGLNTTSSTVMAEGLVDNKAELAAVELELSTIWATINGIQDTVMVKLDEVKSAYGIKVML